LITGFGKDSTPTFGVSSETKRMSAEELFQKEQDIISEAEQILEESAVNGSIESGYYRKLLQEYEKVVGQSLRLMRISDIMQSQLNKIAAELQVEIECRKRAEAEKEQVISELKSALAQVKSLSGLLPICSSCRKIRNDNGYWSQIETYIVEHSDAEFSHGICPECLKKLYPDLYPDEQSSREDD
jgi:hypothetical protein